MEEIFDIYTRDGKRLGTKEKSICHGVNPGFYHKPVWIWIINDKDEILVQKRAACKKKSPNKWDMPSAGHVVAGETSLEGAVRETYEELGVKTCESDYKFMFEYIKDSAFELAQVYLVRKNITEFKLQENEVAEVKWLDYDEFKKLLFSDDFAPHDDEYRKLVIKMIDENIKRPI